MFFNFQLASMRGRYRTMRDEGDNTVQNNGFIMGFSNPLTESVADKTDGSVTVLGYRSLGEDSNKDGVKGKAIMKDCHFNLRWLVVYKLRGNDSINAYLEQLWSHPCVENAVPLMPLILL